MNYYILRHGETIFSKFNIPYGIFQDIATIFPFGLPAVKRLSEHLKSVPTDANFSSPYLRCKQTVRIVEQISDKKFAFDERLGEYRKETFHQMEERLRKFLEDTEMKGYKNISICSHGWPIVTLIDIIIKGKLEIKDLKKFPDPGVLILINNGKLTEINFNKN
jgi:broad specificity phosphatase PhoE